MIYRYCAAAISAKLELISIGFKCAPKTSLKINSENDDFLKINQLKRKTSADEDLGRSHGRIRAATGLVHVSTYVGVPDEGEAANLGHREEDSIDNH